MPDSVEPLGARILIRKDASRQTTRGGIVLPDRAEIPTITGRVVEVSAQVSRDEDFPIKKYDKVLFHPKNAIPVDLEADNVLFVVPIEDVVAVFRRAAKPATRRKVARETVDEDLPDLTDGLGGEPKSSGPTNSATDSTDGTGPINPGDLDENSPPDDDRA